MPQPSPAEPLSEPNNSNNFSTANVLVSNHQSLSPSPLPEEQINKTVITVNTINTNTNVNPNVNVNPNHHHGEEWSHDTWDDEDSGEWVMK